jgi:hypothetical protein
MLSLAVVRAHNGLAVGSHDGKCSPSAARPGAGVPSPRISRNLRIRHATKSGTRWAESHSECDRSRLIANVRRANVGWCRNCISLHPCSGGKSGSVAELCGGSRACLDEHRVGLKRAHDRRGQTCVSAFRGIVRSSLQKFLIRRMMFAAVVRRHRSMPSGGETSVT